MSPPLLTRVMNRALRKAPLYSELTTCGRISLTRGIRIAKIDIPLPNGLNRRNALRARGRLVLRTTSRAQVSLVSALSGYPWRQQPHDNILACGLWHSEPTAPRYNQLRNSRTSSLLALKGERLKGHARRILSCLGRTGQEREKKNCPRLLLNRRTEKRKAKEICSVGCSCWSPAVIEMPTIQAAREKVVPNPPPTWGVDSTCTEHGVGLPSSHVVLLCTIFKIW
ncbi:hypothetical protein V8C37DRAFT_386273 [Trichoderma ceciliae]